MSGNLVALQAWRISGGVVEADEGGTFGLGFCFCFVGRCWFVLKVVVVVEGERERKRKREKREKENSEAMEMQRKFLGFLECVVDDVVMVFIVIGILEFNVWSGVIKD